MRLQLERSAAVLRKICADDWRTASRVIARLVSHSPDGSDDDVMLVWHKLASQYPLATNFSYARGQINWAWRIVRRARNRHDHRGAGARRAEARRRCRLAMRRLANDLSGIAVDVLSLDVHDYSPNTGTLAIGGALVTLSRSAARATRNWLKSRGCQPGSLFVLPCLSECCEVTPPRPDALDRVPAVNDPLERIEQEDLLDCVCRGLDNLSCAFVWQKMVQSGGDWSAAFVETMLRRCGALAGHIFTNRERRTCRRAFAYARRRVCDSPTKTG